MPSGLWRGEVVSVSDRGVYVLVSRISDDAFGPAEPLPDTNLNVGDLVLCGWFEASANQIEIIRKTVRPTVIDPGGHRPGFFNSTFGPTF